ncbi:MAG: hypothetical protein NVSMB1_02230 [Polyangiales bacterium]
MFASVSRVSLLTAVSIAAISLGGCGGGNALPPASPSPSTASAPSAAKPAHALKSLTVDEVEGRIAAKDGHTFVFDNNSRERFDEGHLPTAKWVAFDAVDETVLPKDKSAVLIFYCANEH